MYFFGLVIEFFDKWLEEGRFPREELRIRWWLVVLVALGTFIALMLLIALIVAALE
ncbi:MAG TPA: hypothetical protein VN179_00740 [Solirubrobacterales bacterium]|nr:hypothetical protein [Solirubrobacterales bacterium]